MRRAARTDANQGAIVDALRAVGATVTILSEVGQGVPDLLVGYRGLNLLLEVKDGSKPPSKRLLTPEQERWHAEWLGHAAVVKSVNEALAAIGVP
jgi:hypothetical protein